MSRYSCFKERINDPELGNYTTYGIRLRITITVSDLSLDRKRVKHLVKLCNQGDLDPIHLPEIVEDFLSEV